MDRTFQILFSLDNASRTCFHSLHESVFCFHKKDTLKKELLQKLKKARYKLALSTDILK